MSEELRRLEDALLRAWPPLEALDDGGWLLRAAEQGLSRRANSVLPRAGGDLGARITRAETFYSERRLRPRVQLSPASDPELDGFLAARGYALEGVTSVQLAPVGAVAAETPVELVREPSPEWVQLWDDSEGHGSRLDAGLRILGRIRQPTVYALVRVDGEGAAMARAVLDGELVGIYAVATRPRLRRRGLASACVHALSAWGAAQGATTAYLTVEEDNDAAFALYSKLGFVERCVYWYRARQL